MKKILSLGLVATAAVIMLASCSKDDNNTATAPTLSSFIASNSNLSLFSALIDKAGLQNFKDGPGPFTWFIPTNTAMTAALVDQDSINRMTPGQANYLALYSLVNGLVKSPDMVGQNSFPKASQLSSTQNLYIGQMNDSFYVNGTNIISVDNVVANGVVHIVNRLAVPAKTNIQGILTGTGQHSLFIAALTKANRWATLGTTSVFTVLAPTDAAMTAAGLTSTAITAMPTASVDSLVRYHLFSGTRLFTNDFGNKTSPGTFLGATKTIVGSLNGRSIKGKNNATPVNIIKSDILATNGVVHIIDGVLKY